MANTTSGLLGRKIGMTQLFNEDGTVDPVTVIEVNTNEVLQVKTAEGKDGYDALQIGYGTQKEQRLTKAMKGHVAKAGVGPKRFIAEIRVTPEVAAAHNAGDALGAADIFNAGDIVDVMGTSKGRGFAGVMKRHNFAGFIRSHGTHEFFRHGGSIGTRLTPGHVIKGKKMPGRMGGAQVTVQNLEVAKVDAERNLIFVKGGVPGPKGGFVKVRKAVKKINS